MYSSFIVRKQPIIALNFESENVLKIYILEAWFIQEYRYTVLRYSTQSRKDG